MRLRREQPPARPDVRHPPRPTTLEPLPVRGATPARSSFINSMTALTRESTAETSRQRAGAAECSCGAADSRGAIVLLRAIRRMPVRSRSRARSVSERPKAEEDWEVRTANHTLRVLDIARGLLRDLAALRALGVVRIVRIPRRPKSGVLGLVVPLEVMIAFERAEASIFHAHETALVVMDVLDVDVAVVRPGED